MRHTPRLLAVALLFATAAFAQSEPQPLRVTRVYNVGSTILYNQSIVRQNNFHTFCATGTGTWTVQMQYSDTAASGPWSNFGTGSAVGNDSESCAGSGIGYHPYLKFLITGIATVNYAGVKDLFIPTAVSSGTVYTSQLSTSGGSVGDCPVIGAGGTAVWSPCGSNGGGGTWGSITGNIADQLDLTTALGRKADSVHGHIISDITALQTTLDGKAPTSHAHTIANVTNLQTSLDAKESTANRGKIDGYAPIGSDGLIPPQFVPAVGGVNWGAISGTLASQLDLKAALDAKSDTGHNHSGTYEPANSNIQTHVLTTSGNPHGVTAAMIGAVSTGGSYTNPSWLVSIPWSKVTSSGHAPSHQNGGSDEIATSVAAANAIPKAGSDGKLSSLWIPTLNQNTTGTAGGFAAQYTDWNASSGGASIANKPTLGNSSSRNVGTTSGTVAAGDDSRIANSVQNTRTVNGHALSSDVTVTKSDVGLGSVDNTADSAKPVSTAMQTALNGKADLGFAITSTSTTITVASGKFRVDDTVYEYASAATATSLTGMTTASVAYIYIDEASGVRTLGLPGTASATVSNITLVQGITSFPANTTPIATCDVLANAVTGCQDKRATLSARGVISGTGGISITKSGNTTIIDGSGITGGTTLPTDSGNKVIATPADGSSGQSAARKLVVADLPGEYICSATGGASNAYACAPTNAPTAYVAGELYVFVADAANTSAATVNFSSLGAKTIKKPAGGITTDLATNDIRAGQIVTLRYDGTNMQMISQLGNAPSASVTYGTTAGTATEGNDARLVAVGKTPMATDTALQMSQAPAALKTDTYSFVLGVDNASADLVQGDIYPQGRIFKFPVACTISEITVAANAGTPSVMVSKNHTGTQTALLSGNLATASSGGVACSATGAACTDGTAKSGTISIVTTGSANVVAAGDWIDVTAGATSTGAKRISVAIDCVRN